MNMYFSIGMVLFLMLVLYNVIPKVITLVLGLILVTLVINRWDRLQMLMK
jgi:hypothetical protein